MCITLPEVPSVLYERQTWNKQLTPGVCLDQALRVNYRSLQPLVSPPPALIGPLPRLVNFPRVSILCLNSVQPPALLNRRRRLASPTESESAVPAAGSEATSQALIDESSSAARGRSEVSSSPQKSAATEDSSSLQESLLLSWVRLNRRELAKQIVTLDLRKWKPDLSAAAFETLVTCCVGLQVSATFSIWSEIIDGQWALGHASVCQPQGGSTCIRTTNDIPM